MASAFLEIKYKPTYENGSFHFGPDNTLICKAKATHLNMGGSCNLSIPPINPNGVPVMASFVDGALNGNLCPDLEMEWDPNTGTPLSSQFTLYMTEDFYNEVKEHEFELDVWRGIAMGEENPYKLMISLWNNSTNAFSLPIEITDVIESKWEADRTPHGLSIADMMMNPSFEIESGNLKLHPIAIFTYYHEV